MNIDSPNIYCSILVFILNIFYLFCYQVSKKEKIVIVLVEFFFVLTMIFKPLYYVWHCFGYTNGNPYRFSFLWSFFHIFIAFKSFVKIINYSYFNYKKIIVLSAFLLILIILFFFSKCYVLFYNGFEIIISIIFYLMYIILIRKKNIFNFIIIIV